MRTLLLAAAMALMTLPVSAANLADLRWHHRLVVVTTAEAAARQRAEQASDPDGWTERQLVLVELTGDPATIDGEASDLDAAAAREKLGLDEGPAAALVGLDGGVKQRREGVFTNVELYATVDAMPMRRGS